MWQHLDHAEFSNGSYEKFNGSLPDGGPIYTETDPSFIIVEPWNAVSSLLILAPAVYWAWKLRGQYKDYLFLTCCMPLLFLGGLGSTLFHAFRISPALHYLDVIPTAILTLTISIYFWVKVLPKWWYLLFIIVPSLALRFAGYSFLPAHSAINLGYAINGATFFLPLLLLLWRTRFQRVWSIVGAIILFVLALYFRQVDAYEHQYLPMGTHFLWHVFTGFGGFMLASYLFFLQHYSKNIDTLQAGQARQSQPSVAA